MKKLLITLTCLFSTVAHANVSCFVTEAGQLPIQLQEDFDGKIRGSVNNYEFTIEIKIDSFGVESLHYDIQNTEHTLDLDGEVPAPSIEQGVKMYFSLDKGGSLYDSYRLTCTR